MPLAQIARQFTVQVLPCNPDVLIIEINPQEYLILIVDEIALESAFLLLCKGGKS